MSSLTNALPRRIPRIGVLLAALAVSLALVAGPGRQIGFWDFRTGFTILRWSVYGAGLALVICGYGLLRSATTDAGWDQRLSWAGLLLSGSLIAVAFFWFWRATSVPPIHDISTDLKNPPEYRVLPLIRGDVPNDLEHGGEEVVQQQRRAYPTIQPLFVDHPVLDVYRAALESVHEQGWEVVHARLNPARIEAVATTFWFGFKDDVVVRIKRHQGRTRVDVRSVSRYGKSDLGTNARRIREFMSALQQKLP